MGIKRTWLIKGDCHGNFNWLFDGTLDHFDPNNTCIIILGDAGINFYLNFRDQKLKEKIQKQGYTIYCVRGNHEARPQDLPNMTLTYDEYVDGEVYLEDEYNNIHYFQDYGLYTLNNYKCAVIGGAYSVDKYWRLARAGITDKRDPRWFDPKITGWFYNEQLSSEEMNAATALFQDKEVDFVFTHTCPISWEPNDLFLKTINQSEVDKTMEIWLDEVKDSLNWFIWCFGHFHNDRLERPYVEQYFNAIEELDNIYQRWTRYHTENELIWWIPKSPHFYI